MPERARAFWKRFVSEEASRVPLRFTAPRCETAVAREGARNVAFLKKRDSRGDCNGDFIRARPRVFLFAESGERRRTVLARSRSRR